MNENCPKNPQKRARIDHQTVHTSLDYESYKKMVLPDDFLVVRITDTFVAQHPVATNHPLYQGIGQLATGLVLINVSESEFESLLEFFPRLTSLTLERITMGYNPSVAYPCRLRTLNITECTISSDLILKWFSALIGTLDSLSLNYLGYDEGDYSYVLRRLFSSVRHLAIATNKMMDLSLEKDSHLKHLQSKCNSLFGQFTQLPPGLQDLTLAIKNYIAPELLAQIIDDPVSESALKQLILPSCPTDLDSLKKLKCLELLKVRCHPEQVNDLEDIHLPSLVSLEVICKPRVNLILNLLNDDCLLKILSFLDQADVIAVGLTNNRFFNLLKPAFVARSEVVIDYGFVKKYPSASWSHLYELLGQSVKKLDMNYFEGEEEAKRILPYFAGVKSLQMDDVFELDVLEIPDQLVEFYIGTKRGENYADEEAELAERILERNKSTLTCVGFDCAPFPSNLAKLKNIRKLQLSSPCEDICDLNVCQFLIQNKDQLEHLIISAHYFFGEFRGDLFRALESFTCLKTLRIEYVEHYNQVDSEMVGPAILCVEELEVDYHSHIAVPVVDIIRKAPKLRKLTILNQYNKQGPHFLDKLKEIPLSSLEELKICGPLQKGYRKHLPDEDVKRVHPLKSLKVLHIQDSITFVQLNRLILELPQLETFRCGLGLCNAIDDEDKCSIAKLNSLLEAHKRSIRINGKRYGGPV